MIITQQITERERERVTAPVGQFLADGTLLIYAQKGHN
jgi:hypothetical protein